MRTLHFGYDHPTQEALWQILGERHWSSDLNISYGIPYAETPDDSTGSIQSRPIDRRAVIIEGDKDLVQELLGPDFTTRQDAILKRLNKRAKR